jgi:hypothetical protein
LAFFDNNEILRNGEKLYMKIDMNSKKTEPRWQEVIDNFWKKVTPLWFDWLQWVLVLGVLGYVANQTKNIILVIIYAFSYMAFFFYMQSTFFSIEFVGFNGIKSLRIQRVLSIVISGSLSIAIWLLLSNVIIQIQGKV